jgi:hypothetical protein
MPGYGERLDALEARIAELERRLEAHALASVGIHEPPVDLSLAAAPAVTNITVHDPSGSVSEISTDAPSAGISYDGPRTADG